jgi:hypothetical protein
VSIEILKRLQRTPFETELTIVVILDDGGSASCGPIK